MFSERFNDESSSDELPEALNPFAGVEFAPLWPHELGYVPPHADAALELGDELNKLAAADDLPPDEEYDEDFGNYMDTMDAQEGEYDDAMDGDAESAFASIGWGVDEDYAHDLGGEGDY